MKGRQGTVFVHRGRWFYAVRLPGDTKRRQHALKAPGALHGMTADRPREMAEEAADRMWEDATRESRRKGPPKGATLEDVAAAYCQHARTYYRRADGTPTSEVANVETGLRLLRKLHGARAVSEMTHQDMLVWRDALVRAGDARVTVNRRVGIARRMMAWALDEGLVAAAAVSELSHVRPLRRGRSEARETEPVRPVADADFEAAVSRMMPNTADMARVGRLTGMRPGELCQLRWSRIDETRLPWVYRPKGKGAEKNAWRGACGIPRVVLIGPRARAVLERHRGADVPFSPARAVAELMEAKRAAATSPSPVSRADPHAVRVPGTVWTTDGFAGTVEAACRRAGVPSWSPNRLRHAFATDVRRSFGLEACRAVLGHSVGAVARVTDRYSFDALEDETIRAAAPAVEALG